MSWAVEGCLLWQKEGLNMPDEVKKATEGYREEMDTFSSFIEECCIVEEGRKVSNRSIRYAYEHGAGKMETTLLDKSYSMQK